MYSLYRVFKIHINSAKHGNSTHSFRYFVVREDKVKEFKQAMELCNDIETISIKKCLGSSKHYLTIPMNLMQSGWREV